MEALPFLFVGEESGLEVELTDHDLPKPFLTWGGKPEKTVTRYGGGSATVQIHAIELDEIKLEGKFVDSWWGVEGHALRQRDAALGLMYSAEVVRFEYGFDQLWGVFSAILRERTRGEFEYEISFLPVWSEPPDSMWFLDYEEPPADVDKTVEVTVRELVEYVGTPPAGINEESDEATSFVEDVSRLVRSAQNKHARIKGRIASVGRFADLTTDAAASILRDLRASGGDISRVAGMARSARATVLASPGVSELAVNIWTDEIEVRANKARATMLEELRRVFASSSPSGRRVHYVRQGETLPRIAVLYYRDQSLWTRIADANEIEGSTVEAGQRLEIPELPR